MRRFLPIALLVLASSVAGAQQARTVTDDFKAYRTEADVAAKWDLDAGTWTPDGGSLRSDGFGTGVAVPKGAPHGSEMVVEATIIARRATATEWKTAGIGVQRDERNYWRLNLVEQPDAQGKRHFFEINEAVDGRWLASGEGDTKLQPVDGQDTGRRWEYDRAYRLRIELTSETIVGTVYEIGGGLLWQQGFQFSARACTSGQPILVTNCIAADYRDFRADFRKTVPGPSVPKFPKYVNPAPGPVSGKATRFFHVEQVGGRWWVIDPGGRSFYAVGTDHANFGAHWCEKLGYAPYSRNVQARYGSEQKWAQSTLKRLKAWGFNTLGAGHSESLRHQGLAHTEFLSLGANFTSVSDIAPRTTWTGFPDVFHPRFQAWCEQQARRVAKSARSDPWLFGYFLDNELEWFGKNGSETGLVDETFKKPADHPAKRALVDFLKKRYPTIEALNKAWGTQAPSWEVLAGTSASPVTKTKAAAADRLAFVRLIADRYFAVTTSAVRKADPNHMVIGCRFAGWAPPIFDIAGKYLDIVTVNFYGQVDLARGVSTDMPAMMRKYAASARRPLMITEWSFPALDAGLPSQHGAGQRVATQKDKARAYAIYQKALFGMPFMVGSDYFMWVDEPALGISSTFPEDSNYGLVDVNDSPWVELTKTAAAVNRQANAIHSANTAELSAAIVDRPGQAPVVRVRNTGRIAADAAVRVTVQGRPSASRVRVPAGGTVELPIAGVAKSAALVVAEIDPDEKLVEADRSDNTAQAVIGRSTVKAPALLVINPSTEDVTWAPVAVDAERLGSAISVRDSAGASVMAQVDALPTGRQLAVKVPRVPARSVVVLPIVKGEGIDSLKVRTGDRDIRLEGQFELAHKAGSGNLLDRVSLAGTELGCFRTLVNQTGAQALWVPPDSIDSITTLTGPVRNVLVFEASLKQPAKSGAKTAVADGVYARQESAARGFQLTWQITQMPGEVWFGSRFLGVRNTDTLPWHLKSYYHYPLSSIGGKANDDQPGGGSGALLWHDKALKASYGAVLDTGLLKSTFWKDTVDGAGEHADIWRELDRDLKPGEAIRATAADPEVLIFGAVEDAKGDGGDTLRHVRALQSLRCSLVLQAASAPAPKKQR